MSVIRIYANATRWVRCLCRHEVPRMVRDEEVKRVRRMVREESQSLLVLKTGEAVLGS